MPTTTIQKLGLSVIEERDPQGPYAEYWVDTYPDAVREVAPLNKYAMGRLKKTADFVSAVTDRVIRNQDPQSLGPFPEFIKARNPSYHEIITEWADKLGSFNSMTDGQGDLLRAASILLEVNVDKDRGEFNQVSDTNPRNAYKAFTSLWRNNRVTMQRPTTSLFQAATLVHRAAWTDGDSQRQGRLLGIAAEMYERVCDSDALDPEVIRQTEGYLSDIHFHFWSAQARKARRQRNTQLGEDAHKQMDYQLQEDAQNLYKRLAAIPRKSGEISIRAGHLLEDFVTVALRSTVIYEGNVDFEIRHAFKSEDAPLHTYRNRDVPPYTLRPKPSFDIVVTRRKDEEVVAATPLQVKLGSNPSEGNRESDYLEGIVYISVSDGPIRLQRAAAALARSNPDRAPSRAGDLDPFKRLQSDLGPLLLAG